MIPTEALLELMDDARPVYLATVRQGSPRIRAMVNLRRGGLRDGFTVYFATSQASEKLKEIRANPEVAVYFCDPVKYHGLMLTGRAEILFDPLLKEAHWDNAWSIYWSGPSDPDYAIVRVRPTAASGWWGTTPFTVEPDLL